MVELWDLSVVIPWLLGILFGLFVGSTPGLTATMAVALVVPVSFHIDNQLGGLALILGVSFTSIFAGDLPATFLKIPGTPASAAATLDSYELNKKGQGGKAIHVNLICSCIGGVIGVLGLTFFGPLIAKWSLRMDSPEYFWLAVLGISISAIVSGKNLAMGIMSASLGVFLSTIGMDSINGAQRWTFKAMDLQEGIQLIPMMIGLYGLAEILNRNFKGFGPSSNNWKAVSLNHSMASAIRAVIKHPITVVRSSFLGCLIGALPGAGADIGAWVGYGSAKKFSKNKDKFGQGEIEGVIAPTSANNASVAGAWIPALVFGIPGDAVTAIVLGALIMYDIEPGPAVFSPHEGSKIPSLLWIAGLTQVFLFFLGLVGVRCFSLILRLPPKVLEGLILVFCIVGSYAIRSSVFDLWVMSLFGLVGWFMNAKSIPVAPLLLGFILGETIEKELRSGLISHSGSFTPFISSPSFALLLAAFGLTFIVGKLSDKRNAKLNQ